MTDEPIRIVSYDSRWPACFELERSVLMDAIALVVSEDARKTVLDALFGAEEEFEYTSSSSINGA